MENTVGERRECPFAGRLIVVETIVPALPPHEREKRLRETEYALYEVFCTYQNA